MTRTEEFMAGGFVLLRTRPHERPMKVLGEGRDWFGIRMLPTFLGKAHLRGFVLSNWSDFEVVPTLNVLPVFFSYEA